MSLLSIGVLEPTMAGISAIKQPRQVSGTMQRFENELLRARTRQGLRNPENNDHYGYFEVQRRETAV